LDKSTQAQLARGQRLTLMLKQDQYVPLSVEKEVFMIYAGTAGFLDDVAVPDIERFQRELLAYADAHLGTLLAKIAQKKALDDEIRGDIKKAMGDFKERFAASAAAAK
jgi:F-type H+-transporting ATPase subunit alpha